MSLGKVQEPVYLSPVNNPIPIVFSSSFATENGFRYKVVLNNSVGDSNEVWLYPDTDNSNYCVYDFSMLLNDVVNSNKENYNISGITESNDSWITFDYSITEYIGSTSGDTYSSSTFYTFRGVKQYGDFWNISDYIMTGTTGQFLSNKLSRKYKLDEYGIINAFKGTFGSYDSNYDIVVIDLYDGSFLKRYTYDVPIFVIKNSIYSFPIGPWNINQMSNGGLITNSGTTLPVVGDLLDDTSIYYEIHLQQGADITSETIKIYLDHNCYKHTKVQMLYLGDLSTYETFSFRMADIKSFKTNRSEVKSNYYDINSTQYNYSIGDRGRQVVNVQSQESHKAYTDWIKDDESTDLMELFRSPDVYIIVDGDIYPVIITNTSYFEKKVKINKLFNYTITFEMAYMKLSNT